MNCRKPRIYSKRFKINGEALMGLIIHLVLRLLLFIFISRTVLVSFCCIFLSRLLIPKILFSFIGNFLRHPNTFNKKNKSPKAFEWIHINSFAEFVIISSFLLTHCLLSNFIRLGTPVSSSSTIPFEFISADRTIHNIIYEEIERKTEQE